MAQLRRFIHISAVANSIDCDGRQGIVLEGERFHASILRGVLSGLIMLVSPAVPVRSFATVPEAAAWIATQLQRADAPCGTADQLTTALESARGQMTTVAGASASPRG